MSAPIDGLSDRDERRAPRGRSPAAHLAALLRHECRLLWRYRIVHASAFVAVVWVALIAALPSAAVATVLPLVLVAEATVVGLFFLAGLDLFGRDERTDLAMAVSPAAPSARLLARVACLTALGVAVGVVLALAAWPLGLPHAPDVGLIAVSVAAMGGLNLLVGHLVVARLHSITDYVIAVQGPLLPLALPILDLLGWVRSPWWWLLPTHGPMRLLAQATEASGPPATTVLAALGIAAAWIVALGAWALHPGGARG